MRNLSILLLAVIMNPFHAEANNCPGLDQIVFHMDVASSNIANADTTRTPEGGSYKMRTAHCSSTGCATLEFPEYRLVHDPGHPDANPEGFVSFPSIDVMEELNELIELQRAYEQRVSECT